MCDGNGKALSRVAVDGKNNKKARACNKYGQMLFQNRCGNAADGNYVLPLQALASQGNEIALDCALVSTRPANHTLHVSMRKVGSNPYPCGSLTYRRILSLSFRVGTTLRQRLRNLYL